MMKIKLNGVFVDDQAKALSFYTDALGFEKGQDIPVGKFRWLTVRAPGDADIELLLEPNDNPAAATYQRALYEQGIPATAFASDDLQGEFEQLRARGVEFRMEPTQAGETQIAVFDDTCGNLIQIYQE